MKRAVFMGASQVHGYIWNESRMGLARMSLSSMVAYPRIEDPSMKTPSSMALSSLVIGYGHALHHSEDVRELHLDEVHILVLDSS